MADALQVLTEINLDDLVNAFGWRNHRLLSGLIRAIFFRPARDFARQMLSYDAAIGSRGLEEASCLTERLYVRDVRLFGAEHLPDSPVIILANHPGMTDTLALFAALAYPDLRIIALDRPFLLSLPNLSRHLFFVKEEPQERAALVRQVHRHLRSGGSILTFPSGQTEPDPDTQTGAAESLDAWTNSIGVFARLSPDIPILPVCVRGVNWDMAVQHPLIRLRREALDQHLLASALQLLANVALGLRPVTVRIQVGRPICARDLGSADTDTIHRAVLGEMRRLIEMPPLGEGIRVL